jgi:hypothetical protein
MKSRGLSNLRLLQPYLREHRARLLLVFLFAVVAVSIDQAQPYLIRKRHR